MKKTTLILILFCFLGATPKSEACSPGITPFQEWLSVYNQTNYIIIEGYFKPAKDRYFASCFEVVRSSDSAIKTGQEYEVFEYGPFGSLCEMYEMNAHIEPELVGKDKPRLLIVYKERSINGKLVTPIFWQAGANAANNRIVAKAYNYQSKRYISYECTTALDDIWKHIFAASPLKLDWKEQTDSIKMKP